MRWIHARDIPKMVKYHFSCILAQLCWLSHSVAGGPMVCLDTLIGSLCWNLVGPILLPCASSLLNWPTPYFRHPPTPPHTHTLIVIIHTLYLLMPLIPLPHRSPSYTMGISAAQIWCLCLHLWTVPPRMPTSVLALGSSSS